MILNFPTTLYFFICIVSVVLYPWMWIGGHTHIRVFKSFDQILFNLISYLNHSYFHVFSHPQNLDQIVCVSSVQALSGALGNL